MIIPQNAFDIKHMTDDQIRHLFTQIFHRLEELDQDDYFGTEGWRQFFFFDE